jgi:hypothetical protein
MYGDAADSTERDIIESVQVYRGLVEQAEQIERLYSVNFDHGPFRFRRVDYISMNFKFFFEVKRRSGLLGLERWVKIIQLSSGYRDFADPVILDTDWETLLADACEVMVKNLEVIKTTLKTTNVKSKIEKTDQDFKKIVREMEERT